jgi:tRNA 2-selenouridine synthase
VLNKIDIQDFLIQSENIPIVDVRSPAEYEKAHIPSSYNIPLFNNEERAEVGKIYKQKNKEVAILLGLEFVGPKMKDFVVQAKKISKNKNILMHCWRGGMRSESMAWLFNMAGLNVQVLDGGYKAYRQFAKSEFSKSANIKILSGYTGSGKTDILKELVKLDEQIIDLEGLAHHKGSAFGSIGEKEQLSTEQFENNLYQVWSNLDLKKTIWIEDESKAIGLNFIPDELFLQMRSANVVKLLIAKEIRVKRLVNEYTNVDKQLLIYHLNRISKRLGPNETKLAVEAVKNGNMSLAVDISLSFYDKAYDYGLEKRTTSNIKEIVIDNDNPQKTAKYLAEL